VEVVTFERSPNGRFFFKKRAFFMSKTPNSPLKSGSPYLKYELKSVEQMPVTIWPEPLEASRHVARSIALAIRQRQQEGEMIVLGLATGSTPIKVYDELVRMHREEGLSFQNVVTFNLDEYYPMAREAAQSYWHFMHEYLFNHIDLPASQIHIPDGTAEMDEVASHCERYEKAIEAAGGIDIQLLGIGRTGHIGFNEPGSWDTSVTRMVRLDGLTRRDAIKDFGSEAAVPYRAITMGVGSIFKARKVYLLAFGMHKAEIVREAIEGPISSSVPATFLQKHPNVRVVLDQSAAMELTRFKAPWLVGMCHWTDDLVCKAVIWLSQQTGKPILKLTDEDYNEHNLSDLTIEYATAYDINIKIFNRLQRTITGWPGGKPNADDSQRPERAKPAQKRVVLFSPHPDDDVISMGGTFIRLVDQHHDVHVAYQTSGNIAVHDHDALRFAEFNVEFLEKNGGQADVLACYQQVLTELQAKQPGSTDTESVRLIKGLIRRGEARAGARVSGLRDDQIHFLDMPFYETGRTRKMPIGEADIQIVMDLLEKVKPHQVYAAGDLADPHGTHRVCLDAIFEAFRRLADRPWMKDCWLWMYRGAWHEWAIHEIEMAVPISPQELKRKREAIFMHQSQKDSPPYPGEDAREFWQRAEDRNHDTARQYRALGLAEYEAMEAFVRWKGV
jgi:glucosamine-6-phosphate deaminase